MPKIMTPCEDMKVNDGATSPALRRRLAGTAYARTAAYDAAIGRWFAEQNDDTFPRRFSLSGMRVQSMRYGENPHQNAAFYATDDNRPGVATATQIQGKELSYNNLNDTDAAFELAAEFETPAMAIIKHANPCGVALGDTLADAYAKALKCDPVSAFGGIIAVNRAMDVAAAESMKDIFLEVLIAPEITAGAREILAAKRNLRVLETGGMPDPAASGLMTKLLSGGFLLQDRDSGRVGRNDLKIVSKREPSTQEIADMLFAFSVCKHVKSNAIVYAKDGATVGIGAGQMSRVDSSRIAVRKSEDACQGRRRNGSTGQRIGSCLGRVFPVCRWLARRRRRARPPSFSQADQSETKSHRRRRRRRSCDGFHRHSALPALASVFQIFRVFGRKMTATKITNAATQNTRNANTPIGNALSPESSAAAGLRD